MRQAHLLLPSPLGLLEYDILEDAAFVGPRPKGGLQAQPTPFPGAHVAFAWTEDGFVVRPLPGETPPEINGKSVTEEQALHDGDRVRIGSDVAMFRSARGLVNKPAARPSAPPPPPAEPVAAPGPNWGAWALGVAAGALLLFAVVRGFGYLKSVDESKSVLRTRLPSVPMAEGRTPDRLTRELEALYEFESGRESRFQTLIDRYKTFAKRHSGTSQADAAQERVRDLREKWAAAERGRLDEQVDKQIEANAYSAALMGLASFEQTFGDVTPKDVSELRTRVRAAAQASFDAFQQKAASLIIRSPREAYRMLLAGTHQYPADMLAPLTPLLDRAMLRMSEPPPDGGKRTGPGQAPPGNGGKTPPDSGGPPGGLEDDERQKEMQMQAAWRAAVTDLRAGKYAEAMQGYTALIQQYGDTHTFRATKSQIHAGRHAARVGLEGPAGLLRAPARMKKGRLVVEYTFDRSDIFDMDWTREEPFATGEAVKISWKPGVVHMRGGSGIFLAVVFESDVKIEATVQAEVAKDLGLLAVEESEDYRALIFALNNSKFRLKKGAGVAQPGHLLWLMGKGVWGAADDDFHGYIKIAEKSTSKLTNGDELQIELVRKGDQAIGRFKGKSDQANLTGRARGDDKSGLGSARVGVFTWGGMVNVKSVRIEGKVDQKWFDEHLKLLVDLDPGPP